MLLKVAVIVMAITAIATTAPVGEHDEEDIPVYTEKVMPNPPTKAPKPDPTFKKQRAAPKSRSSLPFALSEDEKRSPKSLEKPSYKPPMKKRTRDIKRMGPKHNLRGEFAVSQPVYAALPSESLGPPPQVVYDDAEPSSSYAEEPHQPAYAPRGSPSYADEEIALRDDYQHAAPKYSPPAASPYLGYAAAPVQRYVPAPPAAPPPSHSQPKHYEPEYVDDSYDSAPQPYSFGYELKDADGATQSRQEVDDGYGNKKGSYGYTDGYGIYRQVEYVADKNGFRATIKTNEPGTANDNPADVEIHSDASQQKIGY